MISQNPTKIKSKILIFHLTTFETKAERKELLRKQGRWDYDLASEKNDDFTM